MDVESVSTEQRSDLARSRALTRPGSLAALAAAVPRSLWCDRASEALHKAPHDFVGRYGPELLHEFELQVQCVYAT